MNIEPGQYQMRNGEQATVLVRNPVVGCPLGCYWIGVDQLGREWGWCENGCFYEDNARAPFDLIAPWPAPVVRDLLIVECGSDCAELGMCAVQVGDAVGETARFRVTFNPAQPDVLEVKHYIRMEPQPDNPETFGISPVWGQGVPRSVGKYCVHAAFNEGGVRVDRWLPCPYQPGDMLDGKRVASVTAVKVDSLGWAWEVETA